MCGKKKVLRGIGLLVAGLAAAILTQAVPVQAATGINQQLTFQGKVVNSSGVNLADGTYDMEFKVYQDGNSSGTGSTLMWTEDYLVSGSSGMPSTGGITVSSGTFNVNLGSICALAGGTCGAKTNTGIDFNQDTLWLSFQVGNTSSCTVTSSTTSFHTACGGDGEMTPFIRLTAVPYAMNANKVGGLTASQLVQLSPSSPQSGNISLTTGNSVTAGTVNANTLDAASSGALTVGSSNATSISLAKNTTLSSGLTMTLQGNNALILGSTTNAGGILFQDGTSNNRTVTLTTPGLTNSYSISWATTGATGNQCLQSTSGSTSTVTALQWGSCGSGGSVSLAAVDSAGSANANGATLTGSVLNLNSADATHPGVINATTQTFGGDKTFNGNLSVASGSNLTVTAGTTSLTGPSGGSSTAVAVSTGAASNKGLTIQGASSQTADLLQLQDSTGANLERIDALGNQETIGYFDNGTGGIGQFANLLLNSEVFGTTWTTSNVTLTSNDAGSNPAPDGQTTADKFVSTATSATVKQACSSTACKTNNGTYTFSVWLKTNSGTQPVQLRIDSAGSTPTTGTAASYTATTTWQRFSVTQTFSGTPTSITPTILIVNNTATVVGWGGQVVAGSLPLVYSRTTNAAVSLSAGVVSNGGLFVSANSATDNPLVVQAAPSQSGDLLQLQDASGNVLSKFDSSGNLSINSTTLNSTTLSFTGAGTVQSASGSNLTVSAQGSGNLNLSTGTGVINLQGNTALSANSGFSAASGTGSFDMHLASGAFQTSTGAVSLNGNTTVTGIKTLTVNGGLTTLQGGLTANGGTINLNASSNNNTNINTGSSTGNVSIGNSAAGNVTVNTSASTNTTVTGGQSNTFVKAWGGTGSDSGTATVKTSDGGYAVTGDTTSFGAGNDDMFIAKYDASGTLSWSKTWGGSSLEFGQSLVQTSDGGYAVTGETSSFGAGSYDMFIAKYDSAGNFKWSRTWGGSSDDFGYSLVQTSDGGYAVSGETLSFGAGGIGDMFLAKYDASGNLSWSKTWGGTGNECNTTCAVVQTSDGGYAVTGDTTSFGAGSVDAFLAKFDSTGTLSWSKTWGGAQDEVANSLVQTSDGGFAITGRTNSFGVGGGGGTKDVYIAKYTSTGTLSWSKTWGGTSDEYGNAIVQTSDGGYAVGGYTYSFGAGSADSLLIKYDSAGTFSWSKTWGGTGDELGRSVVQTKDGGYALTGSTNSFGAGAADMFLAKFDSTGGISGATSTNLKTDGTDYTSTRKADTVGGGSDYTSIRKADTVGGGSDYTSTSKADGTDYTSTKKCDTTGASGGCTTYGSTRKADTVGGGSDYTSTRTTVHAGAAAVNAVAVNGSTSISGQLSAGSTTIQGGLLIQAGANTPIALLLQNAAGMNSLAFDTTTNTLQVFDAAGSGNYALVMYTGSTAIFAASSGTTQIGTGSGSGGDINLTTSTYTDKQKAYHTGAVGANVGTTFNDFSFQRQLNASSTSFTLQGNVLDVEDVATLGSGTSSPNVLYVNQNNSTATGNLILAQTGGTTNRFKVDTSGNVDINGLYKINGTAINLTPTLQNVYDNSSSPVTVTTSSATKDVKLVAGSAPSVDLLVLDEYNGANTVTTTGTAGLHIIAPSTSGSAGFTYSGVSLDGPTSQSGNDTDTAINITTGWDIGLNISSGGMQLSDMTEPSAPAAGNLRVYAQKTSGKMFLWVKGPSGVATGLQSSLWGNNVMSINVSTAATAPNTFGTSATTTGTASTPAATEQYGYMKNLVSAVTTVAHTIYSTDVQFDINSGNCNSSTHGGACGFFTQIRAAYPDTTGVYQNGTTTCSGTATTGVRTFVGLTDQTGSVPTAGTTSAGDNPAGNRAGFSYNYTCVSGGEQDTTWHFTTKDGTTETRVDTTMGFAGAKAWDFYIYAPPNSASTVYWRIDNLTDGTTVSCGVGGGPACQTTHLPTNGTFMRPGMWMNNINAVSRNLRYQRIYTESDR